MTWESRSDGNGPFGIIFQLNNLYFLPWCTPASVAFWNKVCLWSVRVWQRVRESPVQASLWHAIGPHSWTIFTTYIRFASIIYQGFYLFCKCACVVEKAQLVRSQCWFSGVWGEQMCACFLVCLFVDYWKVWKEILIVDCWVLFPSPTQCSNALGLEFHAEFHPKVFTFDDLGMRLHNLLYFSRIPFHTFK